MSTVNKIAKNTLFLLFGRMGTKLITFFVVIYLARYLGDSGYGKYSFALAYVSFFTIISELGIHDILVREISKRPQMTSVLLGNAIIIQTILSFFSFALAYLVINLANYPLGTKISVYFAAFSLFYGAVSAFGISYEVNLKMEYSIFFNIISRIFLLISSLLVISQDLGLNWLIIVTVLADGIHYGLMVVFSKKFERPQIKFDGAIAKHILKESLPLALTSVFIIIYFRIDIIMISFLRGDSEVGLYSAAYRLTDAFLFIPASFRVSILPIMSKLHEKSADSFSKTYIKSVKYISIIAFPLALGVSVLSDNIIMTVYGDEFLGSSKALLILIWATCIIFINTITSAVIISSNKQKYFTIVTGIGALLNVIMNFYLIPLYGYNGAAVATVITEFSCAVLLFKFLPSTIQKKTIIANFIAPFTAATIMAIYLIYTSHARLYFDIIIAMIIYFVVLFLIGDFDAEDKIVYKKILKN